MKVRSKKKLIYDADRLGVKEAIITISLVMIGRDDVEQIVKFKALDTIPPKEVMPLYYEFPIYSTEYSRTYDEYETGRQMLLSNKTYTETGLELEDKLLQDYLLYSLTVDPIYGAEGSDWEAYSDPIVSN